jgi:ATP-dependent Clp protease ATP-binding subunit ClpC
MDFSKFNLTPSSKDALINAQKLATKYKHLKTIDLHLIVELFNQDNVNIDGALLTLQIDKFALIDNFLEVLKHYKEPRRKKKIYAPEILEILEDAKRISKKRKHPYIGIDHILLSILRTRDDIALFFSRLNLDSNKFYFVLSEIVQKGVPDHALNPALTRGPMPEPSSKNILEEHCENLNLKIAKRGTYEIFGRDEEIDRSFECLLRRNKSNVILVGEAGVGKTAIVEGMAEKIVGRKCPDLLLHKEILLLDITSVISGTIYRGQMEERIKKLLKELKENPQYIVFIDEIHMIVDSGGGESSIDFANILKPALSRGEISCIGATTLDEYKRFFEKDAALNRRFEKVIVEEPSLDDVKDLLMKAKKSYEKFHQVVYEEDTIDLIIQMCLEYLPKKKFPDKAFDVLDESGAKTKINNIVRPKKAKDLESKLSEIKKIDSDEFEKYHKEYIKILEKWGGNIKNSSFNVDTDIIYDIFASKLGTEPDKLKNKENIYIEGKIGF